MELDTFTEGYIICALWAEMDNSTETVGNQLQDNYGIEDIAPEALEKIVADCTDFQQANMALLDEYVALGYTLGHAGHDFWLTRNGHGTGFWDRGLGDLGHKLTAAAKVYGSCDIYVGDDNKLYV